MYNMLYNQCIIDVYRLGKVNNTFDDYLYGPDPTRGVTLSMLLLLSMTIYVRIPNNKDTHQHMQYERRSAALLQVGNSRFSPSFAPSNQTLA